MGSKITTLSSDKQQIQNLVLLGKIWGFLKYHHPKVAAGEYNWDFELFRILPKIQTATNQSTRDKILIQWIDSLGVVPSIIAPVCKIEPETKQKPDYSWINKKEMGSKLVEKLLFIQKNRCTINNYYVKVMGRGPAYFEHEESYTAYIHNYPDAGFRLLSLYRFWNIVQYYYPYKYLIPEQSWDNVLKRLIPTFVMAKNAQEYRSAIISLLHSVYDSHVVLYNDELEDSKKKPFVNIRFIDDKPVVAGIRDEATQLKLGDIILEKNGEKIENIVQKMLPFTPASNKTTQFRSIREDLLKTNDKTLNLKILRNDSLLNVIEPTDFLLKENPFVKSIDYDLIPYDMGYMNLGTLNVHQLETLFEQFKEKKGVILDIRNYPAEFQVVYKLSEYLMPQPVEFVKFTNAVVGCPGLFNFKTPLKVGKENADFYKGKIVILVNEATQSRAEFFAMAFRKAPKAIVMGSQTAGADGDFSGISLPGGYETGISGAGVYYPDGKETQRIGIVPDIEVKQTIKGIKKGKDELLEKAIDYIRKD